MSLTKFTLDSLKDVEGGKVKAMLETHVKRAALDCLDRPMDPKPRTVTLTIDLVPVTDDRGYCDKVSGQFHVGSKVPPHRTNPVSFGLQHNGSLLFNPDSPGEVDQKTFMNEDD